MATPSSLSNDSQSSSYAKSTLGGNIQSFMAKALTGGAQYEVSRSNLWYFDMDLPQILKGKFLNSSTRQLLGIYANEVNTPTRQVMTAGAKIVGSEYNYVTGSAFSETTIQFYVPRNHMIITVFERWMNIMANDANQYVDYYDKYVSPTLVIYKLERGFGGIIPLDQNALSAAGLTEDQILNKPKYNDYVGKWVCYNVFPKNLSTQQFNNQPGSPVTVDVTFAYERYRFFPRTTNDMI